MPTPPTQPKIYHIAHVDRLSSIVGGGGLWSDAVMSRRQGAGTTIGMSGIKQRRLVLPVACHPGTHVGDYVPFYFCPRSIMLFVIKCANSPELSYQGGQEPIIHMEADLHQVVAWADSQGQKWAFSLSNAGAAYTQFRSDLAALGEINWPAVAATDFRPPDIKEGKQAEFLIYGSFPWQLVSRVGVQSRAVAQQVANTLSAAAHRPAIEIRTDWYY
ncbi:DarT domain-containing protein [uncultured Gammaproteobacteria bacterium]